jgi:hypothetical protein
MSMEETDVDATWMAVQQSHNRAPSRQPGLASPDAHSSPDRHLKEVTSKTPMTASVLASLHPPKPFAMPVHWGQ